MFRISKKKDKKCDEDVTPEEQDYIDSIKGENPYAVIVFFMGALSFMKGYTFSTCQ